MGEYSKVAQGSFLCTAQYQVINLPFVPNYVKVVCQNGSNYLNAAIGSVISIEWTSSMLQGDGLIYRKVGTVGASGALSGGAVVANIPAGYYYPLGAIDIGGAGSGITTFSAGLSFSFGAQEQIASITKASPAVVTTASAHGYVTGDIVLFEGISGMQQISGIPFQITVTGTTTFTIPWNTNQSNYTALSGSPTGAYVKKVLYPFLYAPGVSIISAIGLGTTTTITTTTPHNLVVGSQVAFRIPSQWGTTQLNSLPNTIGIPGSPMYGYVTAVNSTVQVTVNIDSSAYTAYTSNIATSAVPGLSFPQMLAVGDVNTGGWPISTTTPLYPSPVVNGVTTTNGPAIQGAFVNNTRQGFVIGSALLTPGAVNTSVYYWQASVGDYVLNTATPIAVG